MYDIISFILLIPHLTIVSLYKLNSEEGKKNQKEAQKKNAENQAVELAEDKAAEATVYNSLVPAIAKLLGISVRRIVMTFTEEGVGDWIEEERKVLRLALDLFINEKQLIKGLEV